LNENGHGVDSVTGKLENMNIVIIGNGVAGNSALSAIREINQQVKITMISRENVSFYSPCIFHKYLSGEKKRDELFLKSLDEYSREKVNLILGKEVINLDPECKEIILMDNESIHFDKLILATGGDPVLPPIKGLNKKNVFTFKTLEDADNLFFHRAKKAVIVGSGPIGVEAAIALKKRGSEVYIIEILDRIMPRLFDGRASTILKNILEKHGIKVLTREKVLEIFGRDQAESVITDQREISCDTVIMATGVRPNVELARKAGLQVGKFGGIKVDEYMQTSVKDIYACGDCVESKDIVTGEETLSLLWHNAKRQGKVAGYNSVGLRKRYIGSFNAVVIDIFDMCAVSLGKAVIDTQGESNYDVIEKTNDSNYYKLVIKEGRVVGAQFLLKNGNIGSPGLLFSLITRKDKIECIKKEMYNKKLLFIRPWRSKIYKYLGEII